MQVRAGFHGGEDVWTRDVLNLGVRPDRLIAKVRMCVLFVLGHRQHFNQSHMFDNQSSLLSWMLRGLRQVRQRFEAAGGTVLEMTGAEGVAVHPNGVSLDIPKKDSAQAQASNGTQPEGAAADGAGITGRLLIDCMGNFSPIVRQARWGQRPDGVCLVVGTCSRGFQHNTTGVFFHHL